jgi:DNA-binding CsgD family transcriptional regulator
MSDPSYFLVLVIALATGLVAAIAVAQKVTEAPREFYRHYLTHLLLFNLLILAGMVFRYVQQAGIGLPPMYPLGVLTLAAALKLGWLRAFMLATARLDSSRAALRPGAAWNVAGTLLFLGYSIAIWLSWFLSLDLAFQLAVIALETVILAGAAYAMTRLLSHTEKLPAGPRKTSLGRYGLYHLGLLILVLLVMVAGWAFPDWQPLPRSLASGIFLFLFNLFPLFWLRLTPPPAEAPRSQQFEWLRITPREREIIDLIQAGKTNREIAEQLFISVATVKDHNNNLFRKCGVRNRVELAGLFREESA